jgi:hypothetical protein
MEELCEPKLLKNKNKHTELSPTRASHAERRPTKTKKESVNADPNPQDAVGTIPSLKTCDNHREPQMLNLFLFGSLDKMRRGEASHRHLFFCRRLLLENRIIFGSSNPIYCNSRMRCLLLLVPSQAGASEKPLWTRDWVKKTPKIKLRFRWTCPPSRFCRGSASHRQQLCRENVPKAKGGQLAADDDSQASPTKCKKKSES